MDHISHFQREALAFEAAARRAADPHDAGGGVGQPAPLVPSCPNWSMADLVVHLGGVHRFVIRVIEDRLAEPPDAATLLRELPADHEGWPLPGDAQPHRGPVPVSMVDHYADGAARLERLFREVHVSEPVWTWSDDRTVGFWLRIQAIEAAVHRWDAENALGAARPVDAELAVDAVHHSLTVMAPARRAWTPDVATGSGERYRFRQTDGAAEWTVCFDGDTVRYEEVAGPCDVELAGTASDLMLFLWQRLPADRLTEAKGDRALIDRYFTLVPPV
ncbi:maleylpyruvate isomerase family mycothiol-dependent enzyme [Streptomyces zagrosensis]|uniref:Uncharacterized protein (TIGR03083 family) n=1 Tax=Streptomyces zagrosensis TaxID=1042984 RepID=A0A7W9QG13_9ACTN|nr:maleylpyruvate isomerase family mycothiol-dependent enzyme [Streptomyces zagrosensis]MBB5938332.1 uncharacterized protein (TIGR03083 family) [Streptomyces zagrosensis]